MLDHLRQRIAETLASVNTVTLSTFGPADIQAQILPCEAIGQDLYVLVPRTSDMLLNIEENPAVVVTTENWQVQGTAEVMTACSVELHLARRPDAPWSKVVRIAPTRLHIAPADRLACSETIDVF